METEDCLDENQGSQHNYDDDDEHDSDVEARLYAEVYHSNTIIGEENDTNNSTSESQCTGTLNGLNNSNNPDLLHGKITNQPTVNGNILRDSNISNDSTSNVITSSKNTNKEPNAQNAINFLKESISTQKVSNSSNTPNSKKRISNDCLDGTSKSSKKRKVENQNGTRETHSSKFDKPPIGESNQQKNGVQCDGSLLVNPYNKNLNSEKSMKLLSPEFINLVFTGKSQQKKSKRLGRSEREKKKASNVTKQNADVTKQPSSVKPIENGHKKGSLPSKSAVIDISSESSEDDSKYNKIVATDKKLKKRESGLKNTHYSSDSEESILEVPVPPKPAPPIIEVKDSDNEREKDNSSESDNDSFLNDSCTSQETAVQNEHEISLDSSMNKTQDTCETISDDDSNSLILNCTEVPKGVSSLSEIKKMNQQPLKSDENNSSLNKTLNSQNKSGLSQNSVHMGQSSSNSKIKQKSVYSSKNMPAEEYFFQPMTDKMTSFYNNSWGGENFDMDEIKSNMSKDPKKWAILNKDLVLTGPRKKRYFGMTCARCHKDGHRQNDCPEPNKGPTCHMCGANGHFATYCPHTKCLTCGRKQTMYRTSCGYCEKLFCSRCRSQGHKDDSCPDLWRRYHHTTNSTGPKIPLNVKNVMKSRYELFCCNCTKQGHDSMACRKLRWSQHFPNPSFVTHYSGPIYNAATNIDGPVNVDDVQEHSRNVYNNSSNCDNLFRNSVTFESATTSFPRSDRRDKNMLQSVPSSNVSDKKVIFHVVGMKNNESIQSMKRVTLKLNERNTSCSVESWKKLTDFLKGLLSDMTAVFSLEQKSNQLFMYITCSRKYVECLSKLVKQYASRSDFERSQMLLSGERNLKVIVGHLSLKFSEMKNLDQDILKLYEETKHLRQDLSKESQNEVSNRLKMNDVVLSQQKLLMLLYREGFGDESLGQLRKQFLKMEKSIVQQGPDKRRTKKKFLPVPLASLKFMFTYLYYYNNIFAPYESKQLEIYIQKYKDNLDKRNKLLNSSLLFPEKKSEKQNNEEVTNVQDSISNEKKSINSSEPLPSTSQELPILQNAVPRKSSDILTDPKSKNSTLLNEISKQKSNKNLNYLYLQAIRAKNPAHQENLMQNFRNFLKNTRNCLEKASRLNSPQLRDDIVNLQRDLEDETYLSVNKVRKFKKKFREESVRMQQGVTKKIYKKP